MTAIRLFVFGLGYSASILAQRVRLAGGEVAGTSRTPAADHGDGIARFAFATDHPLQDPEAALAGTTHLLSSVPPDAEGDPAWRAHRRQIAALPQLGWIGYLSTTGVYGDSGGDWVDETSPTQPSQARSRQRLIAERQWLELSTSAGRRTQIFRLPGIYGPGRSALDQVRAGSARRIIRPGQFFSRIHVEDIAAAVLASMQRPGPSAIYNIADDEPAAAADVVAFACQLLGQPSPPAIPYAEAEAGMSPMARSFWSENRRVRNARAKRELGWTPLYPDYRRGLSSILQQGG